LEKNILSSEQFETVVNMEITTVKTFYDFGHNFLKNQPFWPFFYQDFGHKLRKKSGNPGAINTFAAKPFFPKSWCQAILAIFLLPNQHSIPGVSHKKMVWILGSFSEFTMFLPFF